MLGVRIVRVWRLVDWRQPNLRHLTPRQTAAKFIAISSLLPYHLSVSVPWAFHQRPFANRFRRQHLVCFRNQCVLLRQTAVPQQTALRRDRKGVLYKSNSVQTHRLKAFPKKIARHDHLPDLCVQLPHFRITGNPSRIPSAGESARNPVNGLPLS